jgi:hypothetical protein
MVLSFLNVIEACLSFFFEYVILRKAIRCQSVRREQARAIQDSRGTNVDIDRSVGALLKVNQELGFENARE